MTGEEGVNGGAVMRGRRLTGAWRGFSGRERVCAAAAFAEMPGRCEICGLAGLVPASDGLCAIEDDRAVIKRMIKGIWWMPWRQEAMKDVARCEKPGGDASDR